MKNLTALFILAGGILCTTFAYAGDTTALKAEKICSPQIDIFNIDNLETLLGIVNGEKLASYEVVLSTPTKEGGNDVYKFNNEQSGDFKRIMARIKEHALPGSILFIDAIKTNTGASLVQTAFYLR